MKPPISIPDWFLTYARTPAWKRLINHPLTTAERTSLIADLFSDHDETKAAKGLRGDDAQSFVDVVGEVLPHAFTSGDFVDLNPNFPVSPSRCWIS